MNYESVLPMCNIILELKLIPIVVTIKGALLVFTSNNMLKT